MAGENPTQAAVPEMTNLMVALQQYVQVAGLIQRDQQKVLAQLIMGLKPPSVFKSGTWFDNVGTYELAPIGPVGQAYFQVASNPVVVCILNLQDADKIRLVFNTQLFNIGVNFMAYALSPSDLNNQIPVDQFSYWNNVALGGFSVGTDDSTANLDFSPSNPVAISGNIDPVTGNVTETADVTGMQALMEFQGSTATNAALLQISDEIPCSGNKYIHIFGFINGSQDAISTLQNNSSNCFLSYALIK